MTTPSPLTALQRAMTTALLADDGFTALAGDRLRDQVDAATLASPYMLFDSLQWIDEANGCAPDFGQAVATLSAWASGAKAKLVAMDLAWAARLALAPMTLDGWEISDAAFDILSRMDGQGLDAQAILTVTWQLSPA